jgi:NDP-sugar pyrophosphorylase family protein
MKRAIILAGGKGERLRPLTQDRPKCMVEVLGTPILSFQLNWLRTYGVTTVTIACGYMHEMIKSYYGNGSKMGMDINYLIEDQPLGRGGAMKRAIKSLGDFNEPILALNGDNITNLSIDELEAAHRSQQPFATLVTTPLRSPFGIVECKEDGTITAFREKPELSYQVNAGIYVLDPRILDLLPDQGDHEVATFPSLAQRALLYAYRSKAFWRTVDTVKDIAELRTELESIFLGALFQPKPAEQISTGFAG